MSNFIFEIKAGLRTSVDENIGIFLGPVYLFSLITIFLSSHCQVEKNIFQRQRMYSLTIYVSTKMCLLWLAWWNLFKMPVKLFLYRLVGITKFTIWFILCLLHLKLPFVIRKKNLVDAAYAALIAARIFTLLRSWHLYLHIFHSIWKPSIFLPSISEIFTPT